MSRSDRSEFVALVAVVCTVLVFLVGLAAGGAFGSRQTLNQPISQPESPTTEAYQEQRGPSEGYRWPEFSTRDTYAQWAMSVLALLATATGIVGVIWIRQTLEATRDAIEVTREIGVSQARAYLGVSEINASIQGDFLNAEIVVEVRIGNGGQTPARNISFRGYLVFVGEDAKVRALHISTDADPSDIYAGDKRRVFFCNVNLSAVEIAEIEKHGGGFKLAGTVWYTPVVGRRRHFLRYAYALLPNQSLLQDRQLRTIRGEKGNDAN